MQIIEKTYDWAQALTPRTKTDMIVLHHAAATSCSADDIHRWHLHNGWAGIGYHFFVRKDGSVYRGRPEGAVGAHAAPNNWHSIGICFEGNFETDTMPPAQRKAGRELVQYLVDKYGITKIVGHRDLDATACPGKNFPFDAIAYGKGMDETSTETEEETIMVTTIMIGKGDSGNAVKSMQGALIAQGYGCGSCGADGIVGADTVAAIRKFQTAHGLSADGICGPDTWGALLKR